MANEFYTFIVVPHGKARFRKIQVPVRLAKWAGSVIGILGLAISAVLVHYIYISFQVHEVRRLRAESALFQLPATGAAVDVAQARLDLEASSGQMSRTLRAAQVTTTSILNALAAKENELNATRVRYEQLQALVAGQEQLAHTYRKILREASWRERIEDWVIGFAVGVLSSLCAAGIVAVIVQLRAKTVTGAALPPEAIEP